MARPHPLRRLMQTPLPAISEQKNKPYRPNYREVRETYDLINRYVFKNRLVRPPIHLGPWKNIWGMCVGFNSTVRKGTRCRIKLVDRFYCVQWFVVTLAHEMVHQYEWDVLEKHMTHRKSFFEWKEVLELYHIPLKSWHRKGTWFKYQNFYRC